MRVRVIGVFMLGMGSLLPPYVPKAALAPQETQQFTSQFLLVEEGFLMKSSTVSGNGARRAYAEGLIHVVKEGESVEKIASRYGIGTDTVRWANKLESGQAIQPGQDLLILPVDGVLHTVARGQTLLGIGELYGIAANQIADQNDIQNGLILAGQELIVPGGKPIVARPTVVATQPTPTPSQPTPTPRPGQPAPSTPAQPTNVEVTFTPTPTVGVLEKPCSNACFITQYYHAGHYALDMQERGGGPIYAAEGGTVSRADLGWNGGYGNVIEIDHGNGLMTLYGHNKTLLVQEGDTVERGAKIADMGNTGLVYGRTGIHVHFEVILKGIKKNPLLYLQ